jgi:hypothetical protein
LKEKPIDLETMAAYLEGRLSPERMAEVAMHLVNSPDEFDVFADGVAIRAELHRTSPLIDDGAGEKTRADGTGFRRWPHRWIYVGAASAAAAAALFLLPRLMESGPGPPLFLTAAELQVSGDGSLAGRLGSDWASPPWSVPRGSASSRPERVNAFRAGAVSVHVLLASVAQDASAVRSAAANLRTTVVAPVAGPALASITRITDSSGESPPHARLAGAIASLRDVHDADWFDLGAWAEQARIAILAGDATFFHDPDSGARELASLSRRLDRDETAVTVVARLRRLMDAIETGGLTAEPASFRALLVELFDAAT